MKRLAQLTTIYAVIIAAGYAEAWLWQWRWWLLAAVAVYAIPLAIVLRRRYGT